VAFSAVADRDDQLRTLMRELPPTLTQTRTTTRTLERTTGRTAPVLANLTVALRDLRPAVQSMKPAARNGRNVLRELGRAAPKLRTTLGRVRSASGPLAGLLPEVHGVVCQVNPMLEYLRPYIPDLNAFIEGWVSSTNSYDAVGHLLRVQTLVNTSNVVGAPENVRTALKLLQDVGAVAGITGPIKYDPYPGPGQVGKTTSRTPGLTDGIRSYKASGRKFERVEKACNAGTQPKGSERLANDKH
jgi:ABC-type transporter Mla subunit MlaD